MATPQLTAEQVAQVSALVARYIVGQRDHYAPRAVALSAQQRDTMGEFFSPQLLDGTRLLVLQKERVTNPEFYPMLRTMGFHNLPDQSTMGAITFSNVVVSHEPFSSTLLFHELVHVEQYRQLGVPGFADLYVRGFLSGGSYEAIPLEINAYTLEGRFQADQKKQFPVATEVARWMAEGKL
jgi:hypothetical protein